MRGYPNIIELLIMKGVNVDEQDNVIVPKIRWEELHYTTQLPIMK